MITKNASDETFTSRRIKLYGDLAIWHGFYTSKIWNTILNNRDRILPEILKTYFQFNTAMLAYSLNAIFRYKFGSQTTGLLMSISTLSMLIGFNSENIWVIFKPIMLFINPIIPFFKDGDEIYDLVFVEIHSVSLLVLTIIFTLSTLTHVTMIYSDNGNDSPTKRGDSWLHILISKYYKSANETFIAMIVEPLISILIGVVLFKWNDDKWGGVYFCLAGLAVFGQHMLDESQKAHNQTALGTTD